MSNMIKCNECNIVIDEMLSYIQNKISVIDEETLVRICKTSFTSEEIKKSKSLLFDSIPTDKRKIVRKNKGKEVRDLADIVNVFKSVDPDTIPVFVARQLEKLPPITFDHLDCTKLLKDLLIIQTEIKDIKSIYATVNQLKEMKMEILQLNNDCLPPTPACNVSMRRGGWVLDSGPTELTNNHNVTLNESDPTGVEFSKQQDCKNDLQHRKVIQVEEEKTCKTPCELLVQDSLPSFAVRAGGDNSRSVRRPLSTAGVLSNITGPLANKVLNVPTCDIQGKDNANEIRNNIVIPTTDYVNLQSSDSEWHLVSKPVRRNYTKQYRYQGKSGTARDNECKFKAAERKIPMFITNVNKETTPADITSYIQSKTQESVSLQKIHFKKDKGHCAYKFFISETRLSIYMDEKLWPEGIVFRRFVNFNPGVTNRINSVIDTNVSK